MGRLVLAIIAFAMAIAVVKLVIVALMIAGLIFRTKETIGLLILLGLWALLKAYPAIGFSLLGMIAIVAVVRAFKAEPAGGDALKPPDRLE